MSWHACMRAPLRSGTCGSWVQLRKRPRGLVILRALRFRTISAMTISPPKAPGQLSAAEVLTDEVLRRLEAVGVHSLAEWRALGVNRFRIFGISRALARRIDSLAWGSHRP